MSRKQIYDAELDIMIDVEEVEEKGKEQIKQELMEDGWLIPLSTEFITDKKFDYEYYAILTYISNQNREEVHRYLYEKGDNSVSSNKHLMLQMTNSCWKTVKRNIKKLSQCSHGIVTARYNEKGKVDYYIINPYVKSDDSRSKKAKGMFVTIPSQIVRKLLNAYGSNAVKVYCTLAWKCRNGEQYITRSWLAKEIGLSTDSHDSLQTVSDILWALDGKVIKVRKEWEVDPNTLSTKNKLYVRLMTLEEVKNSKK